MPQNLSLRASLLAASLLVLASLAIPQGSKGQGQDQNQPSLINGIILTDVPDAPFSATAVIEFERLLPDGGSETFRTINLIARDSSGRTHNEKRRFMPENFHGSPQLLALRLFDPHTRIFTVCDPGTHIARQLLIAKPDAATPPASSQPHSEDLGTTTLNGLKARGTRHSFTIPAKASGIGEAVKVEDEEWYSEDLHIDLLMRHFDPRIGTQTIGISNLKREEPAASMFEVPAGYQILNLSPAAAPAATPAGTPAASPAPEPQASAPPAAEPDPQHSNPQHSLP